jgi:acetate kinase
MDARAIENLLYKQSGLLGVSGVSSDMRALLASEAPRARFAVDLFVYRIGRELASLAGALRGFDALVFTGGIGEHAAPIRARIVDGCAWLGAALDGDANAAHAARISAVDSRVAVHVVPTDEERMILRHTIRLLAGSAGVP